MSSETLSQIIQWAIIASFFACVLALTFAEAWWLKRQNWASFGKSLGFALLTNFIGLSAGLFVLFIVAILGMMAVFEPPTKNPAQMDAILFTLLGFGILFTPLFLLFCKRLFLKLFKIQTEKPAWLFSLVSALLTGIIPLIVPCLLAYFLF